MAAVRLAGDGTAMLAAYTLPTTEAEVEKAFEASATSENPVMKLAAAGLSPRSPVTWEPVTLVIPALARITYPPAAAAPAPIETGAGPAPPGLGGLLRAGVLLPPAPG